MLCCVNRDDALRRCAAAGDAEAGCAAQALRTGMMLWGVEFARNHGLAGNLAVQQLNFGNPAMHAWAPPKPALRTKERERGSSRKGKKP